MINQGIDIHFLLDEIWNLQEFLFPTPSEIKFRTFYY